jgi:thiosulfate/3-mercaptopyruvate sulfurtransferase
MNTPLLPLLIEPAQLMDQLENKQLLILDVSSADSYHKHHIPGAIHISPSSLQSGLKPASGKLPSVEQLTELFSSVGLNQNQHIIVYDDEGGGWAGRLIWTLDVLGHQSYSYLNGGIHAWLGAELATETQPNNGRAIVYSVSINRSPIAEVEDVLASLNNNNTAIWDARSKEEHEGSKVLAQRGGHIPGAVNIDWLELIDRNRQTRLVDLDALQQRLNQSGLGKEKHIITHCQTHHRSGLTYLAMKILGYPNIKGYHGSWSEWGNRQDTPIEP